MLLALLMAATTASSPAAPEAPDTLFDDFRVATFPLNDWTFLAADETGIVFYRHPVTRHGGLPRIRIRMEFAKPQSGPTGRYLSADQVREMDCVSGLSHRVALTLSLYRARNLEGQALVPPDADDAWTAPTAGTLDEAVFKRACAPL